MLNNILSAVNDWMYTYLLLFLLVGTGIYFTIRTRFVQLRLLKESFHVLKEKAGEENGKKQVSSFQALMISTASRVGTGNIAGIAMRSSGVRRPGGFRGRCRLRCRSPSFPRRSPALVGCNSRSGPSRRPRSSRCQGVRSPSAV